MAPLRPRPRECARIELSSAQLSLYVTFISVDLEGVNLSVRDCSTYIWSSGIFLGAKMLKKIKIHLFYLVSYNELTRCERLPSSGRFDAAKPDDRHSTLLNLKNKFREHAQILAKWLFPTHLVISTQYTLDRINGF